jgi:translation elongation factor EF-G
MDTLKSQFTEAVANKDMEEMGNILTEAYKTEEFQNALKNMVISTDEPIEELQKNLADESLRTEVSEALGLPDNMTKLLFSLIGSMKMVQS